MKTSMCSRLPQWSSFEGCRETELVSADSVRNDLDKPTGAEQQVLSSPTTRDEETRLEYS